MSGCKNSAATDLDREPERESQQHSTLGEGNGSNSAELAGNVGLIGLGPQPVNVPKSPFVLGLLLGFGSLQNGLISPVPGLFDSSLAGRFGFFTAAAEAGQDKKGGTDDVCRADFEVHGEILRT